MAVTGSLPVGVDVCVRHEGEPPDRDRFPEPVLRAIGRIANGPADEIRWLGRAGESGTALHESLRLGRAAPAA